MPKHEQGRNWIMFLFQDVAGAASQRLLSYKYTTPSIDDVLIVTSDPHLNHNHHSPSQLTLISWRSPDVYPFQIRGQPKYKHGGGAARISWDWQPGERLLKILPFLSCLSHLHLPCLSPLCHARNSQNGVLPFSWAHFQVWLLGRQYSARYDLAELRHLVTSRPWLTYR